MSEVPPEFYSRADAHIHLANSQINSEISSGKVSASLLYATARFNAWISYLGFDNAEAMEGAKAETIDYFVTQYKIMLEENLDDYILNFESYKDEDSNESN